MKILIACLTGAALALASALLSGQRSRDGVPQRRAKKSR